MLGLNSIIRAPKVLFVTSVNCASLPRINCQIENWIQGYRIKIDLNISQLIYDRLLKKINENNLNISP